MAYLRNLLVPTHNSTRFFVGYLELVLKSSIFYPHPRHEIHLRAFPTGRILHTFSTVGPFDRVLNEGGVVWQVKLGLDMGSIGLNCLYA